MIIKPTVGRVIWYYPQGSSPDTHAPLAAQIAKVWADNCVNIGYLDENGKAKFATSVLLYHEDEMPKPTTHFCCWMPYQLGVAKAAPT